VQRDLSGDHDPPHRPLGDLQRTGAVASGSSSRRANSPFESLK